MPGAVRIVDRLSDQANAQGIDLYIRDYAPTIDFTGATDTTTAINAASLAASQVAAATGKRVRLWGFQGATLSVDGIRSYENLRWEFEDAVIRKVAGTNPLFYPTLTTSSRTFTTTTLTGNTTSGSNSITNVEIPRPTGANVDRPGKLAIGGSISGSGIPAGTTISAIDPANRTITISANATATGTKVSLSHNPCFGTLTSGSPTVTGITTPLAWFKGRTVTGTGIPGGTTVSAIDWTDPANPIVTLSANATASGSTNLAVSGNTYFGNGRSIELVGGTWDPNAYNTAANPMSGTVIYGKYVENFVMKHATVLHNWSSDFATWATEFLGYGINVRDNRITGGTRVFMDGYHVSGGDNMSFVGNYVESGDDCFAFVNTPETLFALVDPRPISNITGSGNVGHSAKGHIFRPATEPGAISGSGFYGPHFAVSDIDFEAVGSAGRYRNAGIGIFDENQPIAANRLLKRIKFRGTVEMGSAYHDGTSPYGVYIRGAEDVTVDATINIPNEGTTLFERYRVRETGRCTLNLSGTGGTSAPLERRNRRFILNDRNKSTRRRSAKEDLELFALPASPWQWLKGTDGTANVSVVANVEGGQVKLTPGRAGTGEAADGAEIDMLALNWKIVTNGSIRLEARVKATFLTGIIAFIGFVDNAGSLTVPFRVSGTTLTAVRNNAVGWVFDAGGSAFHWWRAGVKDTVVVGDDSFGVVGGASAPWMDLAVEVDADGTALFEKDGVQMGGPLLNAINVATFVTPALRTTLRPTGTGNFGELIIDRIEAEMVRAQ